MRGNWRPFYVALMLVMLINGFPLFMAFVLQANGWMELGWIWYLLSVPGSLFLLFVSLLLVKRPRSN